MSTGKYKKSMAPDKAGVFIDSKQYSTNLPYFTLDSLDPEYKKLSQRLLACDYLRMSKKPLTKENINKTEALLHKLDNPDVVDIDDKSKPVIIIEGEKKTLTLKCLKDTFYINALEEYDRTGNLPNIQDKLLEKGCFLPFLVVC